MRHKETVWTGQPDGRRHYGGGIGDVILQMHEDSPNGLMGARAGIDGVTVHTNPGAWEALGALFASLNFPVIYQNHWGHFVWPTQAKERYEYTGLFTSAWIVNWYPSDLMRGVDNPCFFHLSGSTPDRQVPIEVTLMLLLRAMSKGYQPVLLGAKGDREDTWNLPGVVNLVGKVDLAGTIAAMLNKPYSPLVCCHSCLNLVGWLYSMKTFLLYPPATYEYHIRNRDRWAFGCGKLDNVDCLFTDPLTVWEGLDRFFGPASGTIELAHSFLSIWIQRLDSRVNEIETRLRGV